MRLGMYVVTPSASMASGFFCRDKACLPCSSGVLVPDENVLFSGPSPQNVALYQVDIRTPQGLPSGDAVPIIIRMGELESSGDVTIAIE